MATSHHHPTLLPDSSPKRMCSDSESQHALPNGLGRRAFVSRRKSGPPPSFLGGLSATRRSAACSVVVSAPWPPGGTGTTLAPYRRLRSCAGWSASALPSGPPSHPLPAPYRNQPATLAFRTRPLCSAPPWPAAGLGPQRWPYSPTCTFAPSATTVAASFRARAVCSLRSVYFMGNF